MRLALVSSAWAIGIVTMGFAGCSKTHNREVQSTPTAAEQRRIDERRAEERKAEDRRAEERAEESRIQDERRALAEDERNLERERHADEVRRAEERKASEKDERARPIGGGPHDTTLRATPASAVASIALARCDREVRCKHIGPKEKWRTRAACVAELERDRRDDINSDVCRGGVREKELNDCLTSIREEDCGNPLDAITRLNTCRTGNLCVK